MTPDERYARFDALNTRREANGITKAQWARAAGYSATNTYPWHNHTRCPSVATLDRLDLAIDVVLAVRVGDNARVSKLVAELRQLRAPAKLLCG